uniref:Uncharacterized protein n=1 Tax=Bartonella schoenbuchensis (strain DSM 13525 / NCTC 13165 / R1) TaxID=687861 RepID=E6Z1B1_BARSR|nr:hypothetical protein BARSC_190172 [Bartonella schoenbuchensis R1]
MGEKPVWKSRRDLSLWEIEAGRRVEVVRGIEAVRGIGDMRGFVDVLGGLRGFMGG